MIAVLATKECIFFTIVAISLIYFRLLGHLINLEISVQKRGTRVVFAIINGFIAMLTESATSGRSNLAIISLLTLVLVLELYLMNKEEGYFYLYFHSYWLTSLQLQTAYLFSNAIVNLFIPQLWTVGSYQHRFTVFSTTMIMGSLIFSTQLSFPKHFVILLGEILQKKSHTYLLAIYTMTATSVLAVSGSLISRMLYTDVPLSIKIVMYPDIILKNILILGGSLLIIIYLVQSETNHREKLELDEELKTEKEFREKFHSDSLLSYCANISTNCFIKEKSEFILPDETGYIESIMDFIMETVHPEDMEVLSNLASVEYYEKRLSEDPHYSLKIRLAPKPILALVGHRLTTEQKEQIKHDRDWIWVEFHVTVIREAKTDHILTYVSLNSIDAEMMEKEKLTSAANTDPLTGLLNRNGFESLLKNYLAEESGGGTLFMIDMDYFKSVNDQLGHPVGDKVLKDTADILRSVFRDRDFLCRLGGDEFCVFTPNLEDREIIIKRGEILSEQGRRTYSSPDGKINVTVSFSIGIAIHHSQHLISYEKLYEHADLVLYQAKEAGRNTYRIKELIV